MRNRREDVSRTLMTMKSTVFKIMFASPPRMSYTPGTALKQQCVAQKSFTNRARPAKPRRVTANLLSLLKTNTVRTFFSILNDVARLPCTQPVYDNTFQFVKLGYVLHGFVLRIKHWYGYSTCIGEPRAFSNRLHRIFWTVTFEPAKHWRKASPR